MWWIEITELSDKILTIGEKVLKTVPVNELVDILNKGIVTKEFVSMFSDIYNIDLEFKALSKEQGITIPLKEKDMGLEDYPSFLALGLIEHDFNNVVARMGLDQVYAQEPIDRLNEENVKNYEFKKEHMLSYENARVGLGLIPYVVSGDRRFLFPVKTKFIPSLLENLEDIHKPGFRFSSKEQYISSDEYFCIHQLLKNAKQHTPVNYNNRLKQEDIILKIEDCPSYKYISVKDFGEGIDYEKLPKIFSTFTDSDKGTGIGLQVVKRLLNLKKGHGYVISKCKAADTFVYSIRSGILKGINLGSRSDGTEFKLYFQK